MYRIFIFMNMTVIQKSTWIFAQSIASGIWPLIRLSSKQRTRNLPTQKTKLHAISIMHNTHHMATISKTTLQQATRTEPLQVTTRTNLCIPTNCRSTNTTATVPAIWPQTGLSSKQPLRARSLSRQKTKLHVHVFKYQLCIYTSHGNNNQNNTVPAIRPLTRLSSKHRPRNLTKQKTNYMYYQLCIYTPHCNHKQNNTTTASATLSICKTQLGQIFAYQHTVGPQTPQPQSLPSDRLLGCHQSNAPETC